MLSLGFQGIEILCMNHPKISKNGVSPSSKRQNQSVILQGGPPWKRSPRSERASSETLKAKSEDLDRARFIRSRYVAFPKSGRYCILGWVETVLHRPLTNHCWSPSSPESRGNSKMVSACFCWSMRLTATAESGQTHVLSWVQCVQCVQCHWCPMSEPSVHLCTLSRSRVRTLKFHGCWQKQRLQMERSTIFTDSDTSQHKPQLNVSKKTLDWI